MWHLIIVTLVIGMNFYAILQISRINEVTQSVLTVNSRTSDSVDRLSDIVFSQVRNEKKYLISKDELFYNQFLQLKVDFDRTLGEMMSVADTPQTKRILNAIKESYQNYQFLFLDELKFLKAGRSYSREEFDQEKEKATQLIMDELEKLRTHVPRNATDKIRSLHEIGTNLRRVALMMTEAFLVFGIVVSLLINRSITRPLSILEKKTKDIGKGNFKGDLTISSPPELEELAGSFNLMCNKLSELDKMKSDFFSSVTHELRTPLSTIKMGIVLLQEGIEGPLTEGQRGLLKVLEKETLLMIGQVNSVLDLSKMEAGMMRFQLEPKNIGPLIDQTVEEMGPLMKAKKLNIEVLVTEGLPSLDGQ